MLKLKLVQKLNNAKKLSFFFKNKKAKDEIKQKLLLPMPGMNISVVTTSSSWESAEALVNGNAKHAAFLLGG